MQLDRSWEVGGAGEASIADDFDRLVSTLRSWHAQLTAEAQALGTGSKGVVSVAAEVARSLEAQAQEAQQLAALEQELLRLADASAALAGPAATGVRSKRLLEAAARYTMESERAVHAAAAGHRPASTQQESVVALPSADAATGSGAGGLGDNVELF
jgi:methyl-accepting chemotaxis protein